MFQETCSSAASLRHDLVTARGQVIVQITPENRNDAPTEDQSELRFGPFCFGVDKKLWRGDLPVDIRPRSLAVLRYLAARPGMLVTKKELLKQLWPGIYVSST